MSRITTRLKHHLFCCHVSILFVAVLFSFAGHAKGADWPTFLQNGARDGWSDAKLKWPLSPSWTYSSATPPELAWPGPRAKAIEGQEMRHRVSFDAAIPVAVVGDRVVFGSSVDNHVYCRDTKTGKPVWSFVTDGPVRLSPTIWKDKVYVGSDDGFVYCLRLDNGQVVWKIRVSPSDQRLLARGRMISRWPVRTSILVDDGVAFFGAGIFPHEKIHLVAVDAATGKTIWRNDSLGDEDAGRNDLTPQGYLLCNDKILVVPSGRSLPAVFDRHTGQQIHHRKHSWRGNAGGIVGGTRAHLADGQIYASGPHHFLAIDQEQGGTGFAWLKGRQMVVHGNLSILATGELIRSVDRPVHAKASIVWQNLYKKQNDLKRLQWQKKLTPAELKKRSDELQKQMDAMFGQGTNWQTPSDCDGALVACENLVFAGGVNKVSVFDNKTGQLLGDLPVEGTARAIAIASGHLFVSTDLGKIHAFAAADVLDRPKKALQHSETLPGNPFPQDKLSKMYEQAAKNILQQTNITRGFCLVVGSEQGRLAYELARQSDLRIYGVESDAAKVAASRAALKKAGLYGSRVTIVQADLAKLPFSNYFANLIVSDQYLLTGTLPENILSVTRHIKPCGGKLCLGAPESAPAAAKLTAEQLTKLIKSFGFGENIAKGGNNRWATLVRGKLPGAAEWTHQYGNPGNTGSIDDQRVKGGLRVLWYGDPGPAQMVNRHSGAMAPLSANGRMYIQGEDRILAYDTYNGMYLWEYKNPGALRTGVYNNHEPGNLVATDDALYIAAGDSCTVVDAITGKVRATYKIPESSDKLPRSWGYIAYYDGLLYGTSTMRKNLAASLRRRGKEFSNVTDAVFAIDPKTGKQLWSYRGKNVLHITISIGDDRVFFIDASLSKEQRDAMLAQDKTELKKLTGEARRKKEEELKKIDLRLAVALDAKTGKPLWSKPVDVTYCSFIGIGGGNITLMHHNGYVLICGANANGHYWKQFLAGDFSRRRLVVLNSQTGEKIWAKDANYRHRPIIVGDEIIAEPWGFDLATGKEKMRVNPLTGELTKWQFFRPGHHCGAITATTNMLFFRSGFTGYYDLYGDAGTHHFAGHRLGCWVNAIPAGGLLVIPEASAGCVCQFSITSTVVMEPQETHKAWGVFSASGAKTPVKQISLNLGAPGDRRDKFGKLWLAFPRPSSRPGIDYPLNIKTQFAANGRFFHRSDQSLPIVGSDTPWLYTSAADGLLRCEVALLGATDKPAKYHVKLHFADLSNTSEKSPPFEIKLQGQTVEKAMDVRQSAGGPRRGVVRQFENIAVTQSLVIELVPGAGAASLPAISAIEVVRH